MAKLTPTRSWSAGLWWVRDPKGGRTHLCNVGQGQDYNTGRSYWYATGLWPLGSQYWVELDHTMLASKVEQPDRD